MSEDGFPDTGRTLHDHCRCKAAKIVVCERGTGKPSILLCPECDKAPLAVLVGVEQ